MVMQCIIRGGYMFKGEYVVDGWEGGRAICVLQKVERNPTGVWPSGLSAFIQIKLIFAGLLCLHCGHWPFAA